MTHDAEVIAIRHPRLRQLYEYWDKQRGDRAMPSRADLDPIDMRFAIGNVILIDVIDGDPRVFTSGCTARIWRSAFAST